MLSILKSARLVVDMTKWMNFFKVMIVHILFQPFTFSNYKIKTYTCMFVLNGGNGYMYQNDLLGI